jgi:hypothetical protein
MNPFAGVLFQLRYLYDDINGLIQTATKKLEEMINNGGKNLESLPNQEEILGEGWYFNIPFIRIPNDKIKGAICFNGNSEEEYNGEGEMRYLKHKSLLRKVDAFPELKSLTKRFLEQHKDLRQVDINKLKYCLVDVNNKLQYFDNVGNLKFITDPTHNNTIRFDYNGKNISRIIDAAGNKYYWQYKSDGLLTSITSSYGKKVKYISRKEIKNEFNPTSEIFILLRNVIDGAHKTSYDYTTKEVFSSSNTSSVMIPLIKNEINPLNGETTIKYHYPPLGKYEFDFDLGFGPARRWQYLAAKNEMSSVKSINREAKYVIKHPKIERKSGTTITTQIFPDRIVRNLFFDTSVILIGEGSHSEPKLHRRITYSLKEDHPLNYMDPEVYGQYLEEIIELENFRHSSNGLLATVTTKRGKLAGETYSLKKAFEYPQNTYIRDAFGLPSKVTEFLVDNAGKNIELKSVCYTYFSPRPLLTSIKGGKKNIVFGYYNPTCTTGICSDSSRDPAMCRKPVVVQEVSDDYSKVIMLMMNRYDKYGNIIEVEDAEGHITKYKYKSNSGLPSVFLHKIIKEGKNV